MRRFVMVLAVASGGLLLGGVLATAHADPNAPTQPQQERLVVFETHNRKG